MNKHHRYHCTPDGCTMSYDTFIEEVREELAKAVFDGKTFSCCIYSKEYNCKNCPYQSCSLRREKSK